MCRVETKSKIIILICVKTKELTDRRKLTEPNGRQY